jgi:hypothetical protein
LAESDLQNVREPSARPRRVRNGKHGGSKAVERHVPVATVGAIAKQIERPVEQRPNGRIRACGTELVSDQSQPVRQFLVIEPFAFILHAGGVG